MAKYSASRGWKPKEVITKEGTSFCTIWKKNDNAFQALTQGEL